MRTSGIYLRKAPRSVLHASLQRVKAEGGQALAELAVAVSLLSLVLLGGYELGEVAYQSIAVSDAAMAGVQYGTRNPAAAADTGGIQNAAAADAPTNLTSFVATPTISCICSNGTASTCLPTDCTGASIETILTVKTQATIYPPVQIPGLPSAFTLKVQAIQKVLQ